MKVLKFGGSSVGTPESISNVKGIVERAGEPLVVVVSALRGVTDQLLQMADMQRIRCRIKAAVYGRRSLQLLDKTIVIRHILDKSTPLQFFDKIHLSLPGHQKRRPHTLRTPVMRGTTLVHVSVPSIR